MQLKKIPYALAVAGIGAALATGYMKFDGHAVSDANAAVGTPAAAAQRDDRGHASSGGHWNGRDGLLAIGDARDVDLSAADDGRVMQHVLAVG